MHGAVGNASTVPGGVIARMRSRARACCSRAVATSRSKTLAANSMRSRMPGPSRGRCLVTNSP